MKQVLYIKIDEEITSITDRLIRLKQNEIHLIVPRKALLFQSLVNLKILKDKLEELHKKFVLVTTDSIGQHLAQELGIETIDRIEVQKQEVSSEEITPFQSEPIQARRNEVIRDQPKRSTKKKITIAELIHEFRRGKKDKKEGPSFHWNRENRKFLGLIMGVSVGVFLLIGYIALPSATIYISPTFDNISHTVNVTLADKRKNQNLLQQNQPQVLASEEVSTITKETKVFNTTSQEFYGESARGEVTIFNSSNEEWDLKRGTRFQTEEGIIFRTQERVLVPPATLDEAGSNLPAQVRISVEADPFDAYGRTVGDRGNILLTRFILPGLSPFNQRLVWGESKEPMVGGVTSYRKVVKAEDIEAAKKQVKDNLTITAKEELWTYLESQNQLNHTNLVLLDDRRYLKTELLDLRISEDLEGSSRDQFEVYAKIKAQGIAYDSAQLFGLLKKALKERTHPAMRLREDSVHPESLSYEVIDEDPTSGIIKITVTIKGIEEFVVDEAEEAGKELANKVRTKVTGLKIKETEKILSNFAEVDAVKISVSPFWMSAMPRLQDNIRIKLMETE